MSGRMEAVDLHSEGNLPGLRSQATVWGQEFCETHPSFLIYLYVSPPNASPKEKVTRMKSQSSNGVDSGDPYGVHSAREWSGCHYTGRWNPRTHTLQLRDLRPPRPGGSAEGQLSSWALQRGLALHLRMDQGCVPQEKQNKTSIWIKHMDLRP